MEKKNKKNNLLAFYFKHRTHIAHLYFGNIVNTNI